MAAALMTGFVPSALSCTMASTVFSLRMTSTVPETPAVPPPEMPAPSAVTNSLELARMFSLPEASTLEPASSTASVRPLKLVTTAAPDTPAVEAPATLRATL